MVIYHLFTFCICLTYMIIIIYNHKICHYISLYVLPSNVGIEYNRLDIRKVQACLIDQEEKQIKHFSSVQNVRICHLFFILKTNRQAAYHCSQQLLLTVAALS